MIPGVLNMSSQRLCSLYSLFSPRSSNKNHHFRAYLASAPIALREVFGVSEELTGELSPPQGGFGSSFFDL